MSFNLINVLLRTHKMKLYIYIATLFLLTACGEGANTEYVESCNVDVPINGTKLPTEKAFSIAGWAYDNKTNTSPEHIRIQLNSADGQVSKTFEAARVKRPDVVKAFNKPGVEMSGYNAIVPANTLIAGQYEIVMLQEMPERNLKCTKPLLIEVTGQIMPTQSPIIDAVPVAIPAPAPSPILKKSGVKVPVKPVEAKVTPIKKSKVIKKKDKVVPERNVAK
jgi:hypothetical protein